MKQQLIATEKEAKEKGLSIEEARNMNRNYMAACSKCNGWTGYGGMSQYSAGPLGCHCHKH